MFFSSHELTLIPKETTSNTYIPDSVVPACSLQWRRRSCPQGRLHAVRRMFEEEFCWLEGLLLGRQISSVFLHHVQSREEIVCGFFGEEKELEGRHPHAAVKAFTILYVSCCSSDGFVLTHSMSPDRLQHNSMCCSVWGHGVGQSEIITQTSAEIQRSKTVCRYMLMSRGGGHQGRRIWCTFATKSRVVQWISVTV